MTGNTADVPASEIAKALAVVINVRTDLPAAVALASIHECAPGMRSRLVNCDPTDASRRLFTGLADGLGFETVEQPIRSHGDTLDELFQAVDADIVLLLDSDAEILDPLLVPRLTRYFDHPSVFGAGWVEGPFWMPPETGATPIEGVALFQERPYMPFVMLRASMVREAISAGQSFNTRKLWNDVAFSSALSRRLASRFQDRFVPGSSAIARLPGPVRERIRTWRFDGLRWLRRDFNGNRPNYVFLDTGAEIYEWCKYRRGWLFAGIDSEFCTEVAHLAGVTRAVLGDTDRATSLVDIEEVSRKRLAEFYGVNVDC